MYARQLERTRPSPLGIGHTTVEAVARAVVRAIRDDVPEIIVNSRSWRLLLALGRLSPRLGLRIAQGVAGAYLRHIADSRDLSLPPEGWAGSDRAG